MQYIANSNYFLLNPKHAINDGSDNSLGTCTTVAMQMLMGYHNYYSDGRLIPEVATSGSRFLDTDYGNIVYHPEFSRSRVVGQGCEKIGTEDGFYEEIFDLTTWPEFPGLGQNIFAIENAANQFVNTHASDISNNVSITSSGLFYPSTARADIDAGIPTILGFQPIFTGANRFHVVVAYGYATLEGVPGFIVHWGHEEDQAHIWVPSSWIGFQIRMSIAHTHSFVDSGNIIYHTHRQLECSACGCKTLDSLYNTNAVGNKIISARYPISGFIDIPSTIDGTIITEIGNSVFANCTNLTNVYLPPSITSIGESVFSGCTALKSIGVDSSNLNYSSQDGILYDKARTQFIHIPQAITGNVTVPSGITEIIDNAFANRTGLTSITFSDGIISIGFEAFKDCTGLTSVNLSNSIENIDNAAFWGCSGITSLTIPQSVSSIGSFAFYDCSGLTSLSVPGSVGSIGENAFGNCTSIGNIVFQQGVSFIGDYAFYGCTGLTAATIPQSAVSIGANTFSSCPKLSSLTWHYNPNFSATDLNIRNYLSNVIFNSNIDTIGENAFWNCPRLTAVTIPSGVTSIGAYAFCLLDGLLQILIPSSVTNIGAYAFSACSSIEIFSEASSKPSGWAVNWNAHYRPVYYYSAVSKVNCWRYVNNIPAIWYVEGTQGLEYILVNGTFSVIGISTINLTTLVIPSTYSGLPVTKVGNGSVALTNSYFLQMIVINEGIESIEANAFSGCKWLSSITIPNGVTNIGAYAFQNCTYLTTIQIPSSVTHIGASAFCGCTCLEALTIPQSVSSIGADAFANCSTLSIVWNYNPALTAATFCSYYYTVNFPAGITQISANAFANSPYLPNITIPNTVTSVGANAFANSDPYLRWNYNPTLTAANFSSCLREVNFGSGITSITANAFANSPRLASISIPSTVTSIGNSAFSGCTLLQSITVPNGVTSIGSNAFYGCTGLLFFTIPYSVTSVGTNAFQNCSTNLPVSWNRSANSTLTAANFKAYLIQVYFASGTTTITAGTFAGCTKLTSISIPNTITSIGSSAFSGCTGLTGFTFPSAVTSIGTYAFYGCTGMSRIYIPSSVTTMGSNVFQNCSNLYIYTGATSKPSGWNSTWNSSNRPVYWKVTSTTKDVFSGFGYSGSTYYWTGAVRMTLSSTGNCYQNTSNGVFLFTGNTTLTFAVRTLSSKNAWSKINGTLSFSGAHTHTTTVSVSITNSVSISNGSFSINTANLANGTYTLKLSSSFTRASWSGSSTHTFTFIVDR